MCIVCLVYLPLLSIHIADLPSCTEGMALAHFRMLIHEFLNKDPDIVPKEAPMLVFDGKSAMCMAKNINDKKHTRHKSVVP